MFMDNLRYIILKKEEDYLAVYWNINLNHEIHHFYNQGYQYFSEVVAFSASHAIEIVKHNELLIEIKTLEETNKALLKEITELKNNSQFDFNNINPLEVLGFKEKPTKSELKKRYRTLVKIAHPDTGDGSDFIMKLINTANEELKKTC